MTSTPANPRRLPLLELEDHERRALRRARIQVAELHRYAPEDVVDATRHAMPLPRAEWFCGVAAFAAISGVGPLLAEDLWRAGFDGPEELVGLRAADVVEELERALSLLLDAEEKKQIADAIAAVAPSVPAARVIVRTRTPRPEPLPGGTRRAEPRRAKPRPGTRDEVRISRSPDGETATIVHAAPNSWTTHYRVGPALESMTDDEVFTLYNAGLIAAEAFRLENELPTIEVPPGQPQIEWHERSRTWSARGHVLRCLVNEDTETPERLPRVVIDDKDLSWAQLGAMVAGFSGWGMRIAFVADDELEDEPRIQIRNPAEWQAERDAERSEE